MSGPVVLDCRICSQWPTSAISGHFSRERERKTIFSSVRSGAELGQAAVATRWAGEPKPSGDRGEAWRGVRRCRRRGSRGRATASAAAGAPSLAGAPPLPPCLTAPASRSARGWPSASKFALALPHGLDWNPPDWIVPIRSRRSLIRWRGGMLVVQCDHGGDAEHQHRQVLNGDRAPHQESGETETAFYFRYVPPISRFRGLKIHRIGYLL